MSLEGIIYIPLYCQNDEANIRIQSEMGPKGWGIVCYLWQHIGGVHGFWMPTSQDIIEALAHKWRVSSSLISTIIKRCLELGIFDRAMYEKHQILTSYKIQEHYLITVKRRKYIQCRKEYFLASILQEYAGTAVLGMITGKNVNILDREEKTKVNDLSKKEERDDNAGFSLSDFEKFFYEGYISADDYKLKIPADVNLKGLANKLLAPESEWLLGAMKVNFKLRYIVSGFDKDGERIYNKIMNGAYDNFKAAAQSKAREQANQKRLAEEKRRLEESAEDAKRKNLLQNPEYKKLFQQHQELMIECVKAENPGKLAELEELIRRMEIMEKKQGN